MACWYAGTMALLAILLLTAGLVALVLLIWRLSDRIPPTPAKWQPPRSDRLTGPRWTPLGMPETTRHRDRRPGEVRRARLAFASAVIEVWLLASWVTCWTLPAEATLLLPCTSTWSWVRLGLLVAVPLACVAASRRIEP